MTPHPDREWYLFEIPRPPKDAPYGHLMAYAALHAFTHSAIREAAAELNEGLDIPEDLKRAIRAYMARWHPGEEVPS